MGRRNLTSNYPNTWALFGGMYDEKDKHPKETAKREFEEETNINIPYKISEKPIHTFNDNQITFSKFNLIRISIFL